MKKEVTIKPDKILNGLDHMMKIKQSLITECARPAHNIPPRRAVRPQELRYRGQYRLYTPWPVKLAYSLSSLSRKLLGFLKRIYKF